jgi:hypothetical protein
MDPVRGKLCLFYVDDSGECQLPMYTHPSLPKHHPPLILCLIVGVSWLGDEQFIDVLLPDGDLVERWMWSPNLDLVCEDHDLTLLRTVRPRT